jgi:hypothetical protein
MTTTEPEITKHTIRTGFSRANSPTLTKFPFYRKFCFDTKFVFIGDQILPSQFPRTAGVRDFNPFEQLLISPVRSQKCWVSPPLAGNSCTGTGLTLCPSRIRARRTLTSPIWFGSNTDALISVLNLKFCLDIDKSAYL